MTAGLKTVLAGLAIAAGSCGAAELRWYASRSAVVCEGVPETGARLRVLAAGGRTVCERAVEGPREVVPAGTGGAALPNGVYRAELVAAGKTLAARDFVHTNYPWFNTSVGKADMLLPGFTPLKAKGRAIEAVGRRYVFGTGELPQEVWSLGEQLLARPMKLVMKPLEKFRTPAFKVTEATATKVAFRSGFARGRVEQDGLVVIRLGLPETEGEVSVEIPVRKDCAQLFHACGDAIRSNPAGWIPAGTGRVFGSRSVGGCGMTLDNFLPYCWVGTDTRGICFAADTDRGWAHGPGRDAVELHREPDGTVVLKLNLIAEPGRHGRRVIEFALQASPVKPMPRGWRGWVDAYDVAGSRNMLCQASSPTWGCYINGMARYPSFEDWSFVGKMAEAAKTGRCDEDYLTRWIARCLDARRNAPQLVPWLAAEADDAKAEATLRAHAGAAFRRQLYLADKAKPVLYYYTCDYDPCETLYEMPVMRDEWGNRAFVYGSHQDYAAYYLKKMCEHGMGGVYNDNAFPRAVRDWVTGGAWFDGEGRLHPSYGIWALREHARRQVVAMLEAGVKEPWLTIHHTNANILPIVSFATNLMGMEDKYGVADFQDRWARDYIRTVNQGYQAGVFATSIEGPFAMADPAEKTRVTRTMLATLLPHEVQPTLSMACDHRLVRRVLGLRQAFGIGADDCVYTAYYDGANPVVAADSDVMVSAYRRGKRLLLVIGSYAKTAVELPLRLRKGRVARAVDLETERPLACAKGVASLTIKPHDFAIVRVDME